MLSATSALPSLLRRVDTDNVLLPLRSLDRVPPQSNAKPQMDRPLQDAGPSPRWLKKDPWSDVAAYLPRQALLSLRTVNNQMASAIDPFITSLTVSADRAAATLAMLNRATYLDRIDTLKVRNCNNRHFPAIADALDMPPWQDAHLIIEADERLPFDEKGLACLKPLSLSSVSIANLRRFTAAGASALAGVTYPVSLTLYGDDDNYRLDLCAIATIPRLTSLTVGGFTTFFGIVGDAFYRHPSLSTLTLCGGVVSSGAVATLASNPALREIDITQMGTLFDTKAIAAIAANPSVERLTIGDESKLYDDTAAKALSTNTTLKMLDIALASGLGHLARMTGLQSLTIWGTNATIALEDATVFARHARLEALVFRTGVKFEAGSVGMIVRTAVTSLRCRDVAFTAADINALLSNRTLRALDCRFAADAPDQVVQAIALAGHPTLHTLVLRQTNRAAQRESAGSSMSVHERAVMKVAWTSGGRALCDLRVFV